MSEAAQAHAEAFRGYANGKLGMTYALHLLRWFAASEQGIALVAIDEADRVLGYVVGAQGDYGLRMNRDLRPVVLRQFVLRPWLLLDRIVMRAVVGKLRAVFGGRKAGGAAVALESPVYSLVAIGTSLSTRRSGVGMELMRAFERAAAAAGARTMRLSVYTRNAAARALYERSGWSASPHGTHVMQYTKSVGAS